MHPYRLLFPVLTAALLVGALPAVAEDIRAETVDAASTAAGIVLSGEITGDDSAEYTVSGVAGQILSVDLLSDNGGLYFNIMPKGAAEAMFIGATSGAVADVTLPAAGDYVVQVYLMRSAARRDETAAYTLGIGLAGGDFADGLAGGPDWWRVTGLQEGSMLNIHSGPHTRYPVLIGAANGQLAQNRGCRMTGPHRWCSVRFDGSGQQGWVVGRYLTEAAAPTAPEVPTGGPVGNGVPFDATGEVPCATVAGQPTRPCLFGVVRDGPGNAGVWVALGDGRERALLFEGGVPVSADSPEALSHEKVDDLFTVRFGEERYEIPEAVISGG
ncbi:hypothetical protein Rsw2DRAFT_2802 [Rhodobacter ferrooxidans]|uniref:SH3 type 3 domain protein n=2 Tax=Rhodobacter ferrooxidans TaxID=371731 RepID=C8S424_9RHOB|nr:hypothetical protein Rsw2DRAFT_2802 [Rhodobacter sp. SW2]